MVSNAKKQRGGLQGKMYLGIDCENNRKEIK